MTFKYMNFETGEITNNKEVFRNWTDEKGIINVMTGRTYAPIPNNKDAVLNNAVGKLGFENSFVIMLAHCIEKHEHMYRTLYRHIMENIILTPEEVD